MAQTKKISLLEAVTNTAVGFVITLIVSPFIYWACRVEMTYAQMGLSTVLFTVVSIVRGYVIRRWFNKKEQDAVS